MAEISVYCVWIAEKAAANSFQSSIFTLNLYVLKSRGSFLFTLFVLFCMFEDFFFYLVVVLVVFLLLQSSWVVPNSCPVDELRLAVSSNSTSFLFFFLVHLWHLLVLWFYMWRRNISVFGALVWNMGN